MLMRNHGCVEGGDGGFPRLPAAADAAALAARAFPIGLAGGAASFARMAPARAIAPIRTTPEFRADALAGFPFADNVALVVRLLGSGLLLSPAQILIITAYKSYSI